MTSGSSWHSTQQNSARRRDNVRQWSRIGEIYPSVAGVSDNEESGSALVQYLKTSGLPRVQPFSAVE